MVRKDTRTSAMKGGTSTITKKIRSAGGKRVKAQNSVRSKGGRRNRFQENESRQKPPAQEITNHREKKEGNQFLLFARGKKRAAPDPGQKKNPPTATGR